jgi:predicted nucleic acid-binding protein
MVTYVLDTSAVLRFIDKEAGSARITAVLRASRSGTVGIQISAVHWGEIVGIALKRHGALQASKFSTRLRSLALEVVPVTEQRAAKAAAIRLRYNIPYVDSFGIELASDTSDHRLITADFDFKPAEHDISIEFLPPKPAKAQTP